ncbi:MAG: peptidylprolyl isomerase, partial [Planctomycetaceae bacterium]|nr:peptidylprolyl isomerase [Planctomycetaceae bacterium]
MKILPTFSTILLVLPLLAQAVDFNREIRPLLASKCYACHGPDEEGRKAKLRLDVREVALKSEVIVPGKVEESEFHYRIRSDDPDEIMPPPESHATLTAKEKDLLDQWIKEG